MVGKGFSPERCENCQKLVEKHEKQISGNGQRGIATKVEMFDEFREDFKRVFENFASQLTIKLFVAVVTIVLASAGQLIYFTIKIENIEKKTITPTYQNESYYLKQIKM